MENFKKLGIPEDILKKIEQEGFEKPSDIQDKSIPLILAGEDIIAGSATGSGKTLAFGVGIINISEKRQGIQSLVLTPTRELAEQVSRELKKFSHFKGLKVVPIYGGVSINPQMDYLETAEVVVGTPGRVLDHMERGTIDLSNLKIFVLDEADRMLDMGFIEDVEKIIKGCPTERQTLLFSATIPPDISRLADRYMNNPIKISVDSYVDPSKLKQVYYDVEDNMKFSLLVNLLKDEHAGLIMVFCNTQRNCDFLEKNLRKLNIDALAIHGGFSQSKRTRTIDKFHTNNLSILICTDVAARGLDIKGVSHVYNYDIPNESKQYIHRIGRTARAGSDGKAINILTQRDYENFQRVLSDFDIDIDKEEKSNIERIPISWKSQSNGRRGNFNRGNNSSGRSSSGRRQSSGRGYSSNRGDSSDRSQSSDRVNNNKYSRRR
jgi:ATP-dependent RNA helicase DeaD